MPDTPEPHHPDAPAAVLRQVPPLDPPMVPFALVGMAVWVVVGLILLAVRPTLAAHGHENWIAICVAGFLLGFPGLAMMTVHDRNRRRRHATPPAPPPLADQGHTHVS